MNLLLLQTSSLLIPLFCLCYYWARCYLLPLVLSIICTLVLLTLSPSSTWFLLTLYFVWCSQELWLSQCVPHKHLACLVLFSLSLCSPISLHESSIFFNDDSLKFFTLFISRLSSQKFSPRTIMILLAQMKHSVIGTCGFQTSYTIKALLEEEPLHRPRAQAARARFNILLLHFELPRFCTRPCKLCS